MAKKIDLKAIVSKAKGAQKKIQAVLNNQAWLDEARLLAERQKKELSKLISGDVTKVKSFVEQERKALEKLQKEIPSDLTRYKTFFSTQKAEYQKLLKSLTQVQAQAKSEAKTGVAKASKKTARKSPRARKAK